MTPLSRSSTRVFSDGSANETDISTGAPFAPMRSVLDNRERMSEIDKGRMIDQIMGFPDHLASSLRSQVEVEFEGRKILLCGMGGSAISGDILADWVNRESSFHMSVLRGVNIPGWVDDDTFLITVSYSGNTREVLNVFEKALERGLNLAAVTSGGVLMDSCEGNGVPYVRVPVGFQPRAALGHLLGSTACLIERATVVPIATSLNALIGSLRIFKQRLTIGVPLRENPAKRTAQDLEGTVPVIYATSEMRSAALRWHTQINENSKMMAFTGEVPECNHNHIVGWMEGTIETRCRPVFLRASTDDECTSDIMSVTIDVLEEGGRSPVVLRFSEASRLHNLLTAIMYGDFVSYYLAMLNGKDPLPVESIQELKRRMSGDPQIRVQAKGPIGCEFTRPASLPIPIQQLL